MRAILAAVALVIAVPVNASAATGFKTANLSMVVTTDNVAGVTFWPLINVGEQPYGTIFEGIPDGIGVRPGLEDEGWVDFYVTHEQSHVPFGTTSTNVFADYQDSSVTRLRIDLATKTITEMSVPLPASMGFIRFCSAFMAGPQHGFPHYTFMVNEESNDVIPVPAGAPYGSDPSAPAGRRQAGYSAYVDTESGKVGLLAGQGRHNHENTVVVPGGWSKGIVSLSGDDTFTSTSTADRPNLSQLYMSVAKNWKAFQKDEGTLMGFRITGTGSVPFDPEDAFNGANDFFDIAPGQTWTGEFIPVPPAIANGDNVGKLPQDDLEDWSNLNNIFQFIRVEDIAYDPDSPRTVYFADTGNTRLYQEPTTGRLRRLLSSTDPLVPQSRSSSGRVFKMVFNASDPTKVDAFSILADGGTGTGQIPMRSPDNLDVGHNSLMLQEDAAAAKIWMYSLSAGTWTHIATVDQDQNPLTTDEGESSGILDVSRWFGSGWWALDVQAHSINNVPNNQQMDSEFLTWTDGPAPPGGNQYRLRREAGQLLLMNVPGS